MSQAGTARVAAQAAAASATVASAAAAEAVDVFKDGPGAEIATAVAEAKAARDEAVQIAAGDLSATIAAGVPPIVADVLADDPTVVAEAAALAQSDAGLARAADLVSGTTTAAPAGGVTREDYSRTWLEFDETNKPTAYATGLMSEAGVVTGSDVTDDAAAAGGMLRGDSSRTWLEFGHDNGPTAYALALLAEKGLGPQVGPDGTAIPATSTRDLAIVGDSTSRCSNHTDAESWWSQLNTMLGTPGVTMLASSGTRMEQIAAKFGGLAPTCLVSGGTIPTSGSVALTNFDIDPLGTVDVDSYTVDLRMRDGTVVRGTLAQGGTTSDRTFTRADSGAAITTNGTVEVHSVSGKSCWGKTVIVAGGINNETFSFDATLTPEAVLGWYAATTSVLTPMRPRLIVWGPLDRGAAEAAGTANGDFVRAVERGLRKMYGSRFCEVRKYLASQQALNDAAFVQPGFTATTQDNTDVAAGTVPQSFRDSGSVHLSTLGYKLQARCFYRFMTSPQKGWN